MPGLASIRKAYSRGGLTGVLKGTGRWVARVTRARNAPPVAPAAPAGVTAATVDLGRANEFFEKRRTGYETLADAVAPYLPTDGVLFDVGANVGFFTKVLVERTGFSGRAHLFEPSPTSPGSATRRRRSWRATRPSTTSASATRTPISRSSSRATATSGGTPSWKRRRAARG